MNLDEAIISRLDETVTDEPKTIISEELAVDDLEEYITEEMDSGLEGIVVGGVFDGEKVVGHINEYIGTDAMMKRAGEMGLKPATMEMIKKLAGSLKGAGGSMHYGLDNAHVSQFGAVANFRKEMEDNNQAMSGAEFKALAEISGSVRWIRFRFGALVIGLKNK